MKTSGDGCAVNIIFRVCIRGTAYHRYRQTFAWIDGVFDEDACAERMEKSVVWKCADFKCFSHMLVVREYIFLCVLWIWEPIQDLLYQNQRFRAKQAVSCVVFTGKIAINWRGW